MFHRLKIRLIYFWNVICLRKIPIKANIFVIETYNQVTTKTILHREWDEVACLWNKSVKWGAFLLANRPKVQYPHFMNIKAGWSKIIYARQCSNTIV